MAVGVVNPNMAAILRTPVNSKQPETRRCYLWFFETRITVSGVTLTPTLNPPPKT